jgi:hypothetical protein
MFCFAGSKLTVAQMIGRHRAFLSDRASGFSEKRYLQRFSARRQA